MPDTPDPDVDVGKINTDIGAESSPRPVMTRRLSTSGLNIWGGRILEEYLPELRGKQAIAVYNEMRKGNPVIGGFLRAIEMAFRSVKWADIPYDDSPEAASRAALQTSVRNDMEITWADGIADMTTVLPFGHAPFEMTFKIRNGRPGSNFNDNKVGLKSLDLVPQDTIERWDTENPRSSNIIALVQKAPPGYEDITIPMDKIVNFRLRREKNNPEGESILRQAYRPWLFMNNLEAIEGISLERTGAGIPLIVIPKGGTTIKDKGSDSDEQAAIDIVKSVRVDEQGGIVLWEGWEFRLARPEGRVDPDLFDLAIKRHRANMLISVLAAFLEFGTARVGSFALAEQSRSFFELALEGYLNIIEETWNSKVVPLLFELNGVVDGKYPVMTHTAVGSPQLESLSKYIKELTEKGFLAPSPILNQYLRDLARFPSGATVAERMAGIATSAEADVDADTPQQTAVAAQATNGASPVQSPAQNKNGNINRNQSLEGDEESNRELIRRIARKASD